MSFALRGVLRRLVTPARAALVLGALAFAASCQDGPEPAPSPTTVATGTPSPSTPTAPPAPTSVATPPAASTPQPTPTAAGTRTPTATATPTPTLTATPTPSPTPTPTGTATPTPTPTPTASPTPTPSPTPASEPPDALDLIEPAPGAFEHRTFESGEATDWDHGIFVLDPVTGLTDGYRVPGAEALHYYEHFPGGWITSRDPWREWALLLHRASGQSWRWPDAELRLVTAWAGHLLFERLVVGERYASGHLALAGSDLQELARFSIGPKRFERSVLVSPDGRTLAIDAQTRIYLVSVESSRVSVVFETDPRDETALAWVGPRRDRQDGIEVWSSRGEGEYPQQYGQHYFDWEGNEMAAPACLDPGAPWAGWLDGATWVSPDGRYAASLDGAPAYVKYEGFAQLQNPWPNVLVLDMATCEPLFRVRSASTGERAWNLGWLATSDGFVVGSQDGFLLVHVHPSPAVFPLLIEGTGQQRDTGPQPAPTGDGRYFGYAWRVFDSFEDRWVEPPAVLLDGPFWWGDSYRER